jgi:hypothetical protein
MTAFITIIDDKESGIEQILFNLAAYHGQHKTTAGWTWPPPAAIPTGKGMLVWQLAKLARIDARDAGLRWVALKATDGTQMFQPTRLGPAIQELRAQGVAVYGWGYTYGRSAANARAEAAQVVNAVHAYDFDGWLIDAEQEYKQPDAGSWASRFCDEIRASCPTLPLGLCSYRYPALHPEFPWKYFAARCDFHAPQLYWVGARLASAPASQLQKSIAQLVAVRDMPIVPVGIACEDRSLGWGPSAEQIESFVQAVHAAGLPGYGWWEWAQAAENPALWERVKNLT